MSLAALDPQTIGQAAHQRPRRLSQALDERGNGKDAITDSAGRLLTDIDDLQIYSAQQVGVADLPTSVDGAGR